MTDKTSGSAGAPNKQKITMILMIVIVVVVVWQVYEMFGGGSSEPTTATTVAANEDEENGENKDMMSSKSSAPASAQLLPAKPLSEREKQLLQLQQATQEKYIEAMNELQLLKLTAEITETNKGISAAKLEIVKNQKAVVDLLSPQQSHEAISSEIAQRLTGAPEQGAPAQNAPPPELPIQEVSQESSLTSAERANLLNQMSDAMRQEYAKLSSQLTDKQKDAFLRMNQSVKEDFNKLSDQEKKEVILMSSAQQEVYATLSEEDKKAFIALPPQQRDAFIMMSATERQEFLKMSASERQMRADRLAPRGGAEQNVPMTAYTVVSVSKLRGTWNAVLATSSTLYNVQIGDVLPPDNSLVKKIDRDGVMLETGNQERKLSLVPII